MSTLIAILVALATAASAAIYALFQHNKTLQNLLNSKEFKDEIKVLADKLTQQEGKVTESERDYAKAKDDFNKSNTDK